MNLTAHQFSVAFLSKQDVTFDKKIFERICGRWCRWCSQVDRQRYVVLCWRLIGSRSRVSKQSQSVRRLSNSHCHLRHAIRQMPEGSCDGDSQLLIRIKTEEPHTTNAVPVDNIGPDIRFKKPRNSRHRRKPPWPNSLHGERHQPQPRTAVELFDREFIRNQRLQGGGRYSPMQKCQFLPALITGCLCIWLPHDGRQPPICFTTPGKITLRSQHALEPFRAASRFAMTCHGHA